MSRERKGDNFGFTLSVERGAGGKKRMGKAFKILEATQLEVQKRCKLERLQ